MKLVGIKLDMNKAYDQVDWHFLGKMMEAMGFPERWVQLVMTCVTTVSFSAVVNGVRGPQFKPQCGLQ